ncbi:MAG TPA: hypothetical protein VFU47_07190, partial [Armatimonadota bacterium]|nr:hypothetical protein [Armatimonadota bacterium]
TVGSETPPAVLRNGAAPYLTEKNPQYDAALAKEGVTCVTCHVRDETILSGKPTGASNVPHPLQYSPMLSKAELCAGCHQFDIPSPMAHPFETPPFPHTRAQQRRAELALLEETRKIQPLARQITTAEPVPDGEEPPVAPDPGMEGQYQQEARVQHTLDEFHVSPAALRGETCQSCHMTSDHGRRMHDWPGRDSLAMLQKAVSLSTRLDRKQYREGDRLQAVIKLKNDSGHRFPTGDALHAGVLDVWLRDGTQTLGRQVWVMSSQSRGTIFFDGHVKFFASGPVGGDSVSGVLDAPNRADTRLLPGEEATLVYSRKVDARMACARDLNLRVRVFHAGVSPAFRHSRLDPGIDTLKLVREEVLPVSAASEGG